jgi:hypothetical protein
MIKRFRQMFESVNQDQLRDILNIVTDEDIETHIHYYDYAFSDCYYKEIKKYYKC